MSEVISDYNDGMPLASLAEKYRCSRASIRNKLKDMGIPPRKRGRKKKSIQMDWAITQYRAGVGISRIADRLDICTSTLRRKFIEEGVSLVEIRENPLLTNENLNTEDLGIIERIDLLESKMDRIFKELRNQRNLFDHYLIEIGEVAYKFGGINRDAAHLRSNK